MTRPHYAQTKSMKISEQLRATSNRLNRAMSLGDCIATVVCLIVGCGVFWYFLTMYRG